MFFHKYLLPGDLRSLYGLTCDLCALIWLLTKGFLILFLPYTDTAEKYNKRGRSDYRINAEFRQIQPPIDALPKVAQGFSY
jgi:hypothetical protein